MFGYAKRRPSNGITIGGGEHMFPNCLAQVWNPTESGRWVDIIDSANKDSSGRVSTLGLLPWKTRFNVYVCGPTVFSKERWVSRKLTQRELADAVDVPAVEFKKAGSEWRAALTRMETPGKVLVSALQLIKWGEGAGSGPGRLGGSDSHVLNDDCVNLNRTEGKMRLNPKKADHAPEREEDDEVFHTARPPKRVRWSLPWREEERRAPRQEQVESRPARKLYGVEKCHEVGTKSTSDTEETNTPPVIATRASSHYKHSKWRPAAHVREKFSQFFRKR